MRERGVHVVAVDSHPEVAGMDTVYVDNAEGGRLAARHLVELGHRDIVMLRAVSDRPSIASRCAGFREELRLHGIDVPDKQLFVDAKAFTFIGAYERAKKLFEARPTVTAVAAANDELAAGVIRAAHEAGKRIPEDLSVMGFDDIIMSNYLDPPLTSISYDKEQMGRVAMGRLIDRVNGQIAESESLRAHKTELPVWVVARDSTGPAPKRARRPARKGA
jgi:LacI family transcriptional regulator